MKEQIREIILSFGADVCGFAGVERFKDAEIGFLPTDVFPQCKTVVSFGAALPKGLLSVSPRLIYGRFNDVNKNFVDDITFKSAKTIEQKLKIKAVPIPCDTPYEFWDEEKIEGKGLISMKYAAYAAGIGSIGKSKLLINEKFGNMLTLGAILLDIELESDELSKNLCIDGCKLCIEKCPSGAISEDGVNQKLCRLNTYGKTKRGFDTVDCNNCRSVCPYNNLIK